MAEPEVHLARYAGTLPEKRRVREVMQANAADATQALRHEVLGALDAGMTTRRVAELAGVSLDTVNRWMNAARNGTGSQ